MNYVKGELAVGSCIISPYAIQATGYTYIRLNNVQYRHHRIAYCEANNITIDSIKGAEVLHLCDNPSCINPAHLRLGTRDDNAADMKAKGRAAVGTQHGLAKMDESKVRLLRSLTNLSCVDLGKMFGIAQGVAWSIRTKKTWKHVQ